MGRRMILQVDPQHHLKCTSKGEQRKTWLQKKATRPSEARCLAAGLEEGGGRQGGDRDAARELERQVWRSLSREPPGSPGSLPGARAILLTPWFIPVEPG